MSNYVSKFNINGTEVIVKDTEARASVANKADTSYVNEALSSKANQDSLNALVAEVSNKASASSLESLSNVVQTKADALYVNGIESEVNQLSARVSELTELPEGSTTGDAELADIRIAYDGTTYSTAGNSVRGQATELANAVYNNAKPTGNLVSQYVEAGYYSSVDGSKQSGGTYNRTPYLIPAEENTYYVSSQGDVYCACFNSAKQYLGRCILSNRNSRGKIEPTLAGTAYVGLYQSNATGFNLVKLDSSNVNAIEYPYDGTDYIHLEQIWINGNGEVANTTNLDLIIMQNVKAGDKYYVSNDAAVNAVAFNSALEKLTVQSESRGRGSVYTVPADACTMYFNLYRNRTTGVDNHMSDYICKVTKSKVLAIGDSLTWLDGKANYGNAEVFVGWQKQLRMNGYDVVTLGYSGYPYTEGIDVVEDVSYSIYKEIVTNQATVSGYDFIILFGGTNDVLYNATKGSRPTVYANRVFNSETFNGALGGIISYIRQNNSTAKIMLLSFPKSQATARVFTDAYPFVQEIEYNAKFWSCKYVDIFEKMNVQPSYSGFSTFFYDDTHPNYLGMQRIGEIIVGEMNNY